MAAALKPEPTSCPNGEHAELVIYETTGDYGDHEVERGQCQSCGQWVEATVWFSRDAIEYRPLTTAEISVLKYLEASRHV